MCPQLRGYALVCAWFVLVCTAVLMNVVGIVGGRSALESVAQDPSSRAPLGSADAVHVFLAEGCAPCDEQRTYLRRMIAEDATLRVLTYDVAAVDANANAMDHVVAHLGLAPGVIPLTLYGARHWVGFDAEVGEEVRSAALHAGLSPPSPMAVDASLSRVIAQSAQPEPLHTSGEDERFTQLLGSGAIVLLVVLIVGVTALRRAAVGIPGAQRAP